MRNVVIVIALSCLLMGCADALGISDVPEYSARRFSPMGRIITSPRPDNVPLIGPPSTDLW